jgi:hypothetical protein
MVASEARFVINDTVCCQLLHQIHSLLTRLALLLCTGKRHRSTKGFPPREKIFPPLITAQKIEGGGGKFLKKEEEKQNTTQDVHRFSFLLIPDFFPMRNRIDNRSPGEAGNEAKGEKGEKLSRRRCLQDDVFSTQASQLSEPTSVNPTIMCPPRNALCEHGIFKSLFSLFRPFYNTSAGRFFEYLKEPPVPVPRNTSDSKNRRLG